MPSTNRTAASAQRTLSEAMLDELVDEVDQLKVWLQLTVMRREKLWRQVERLELQEAAGELATCFGSVPDASIRAAVDDLDHVRLALVHCREAVAA